jgi:hypothetical protein
MLNQFIESELGKLDYPTLNQTDTMLALKIRTYLLNAQEKEVPLPQINDVGLPLVHSLAKRRYFRCLEVVEDFYHNSQQVDKSGRNYFYFLIACKSYDVANQLITRWQRTGEEQKFKDMTSRNVIYLLNLLIDGVKRLDNNALQILLEVVKKYTLPSGTVKDQTVLKSLHLIKQTLKTANQNMKSKAAMLGKRLGKFQRLFEDLRANLSEGKPTPIIVRLSAEIKELTELSSKLSEVNQQELLKETADQKNIKSVIYQCKKYFKTFMGKSYKHLDRFSPRASQANLRYFR